LSDGIKLDRLGKVDKRSVERKGSEDSRDVVIGGSAEDEVKRVLGNKGDI
jgi:hypothetical protein